MDWETLGACNTYQFTVLDCPLDRQVAVRTALENRVEYATELPVQSDELLSKTMRERSALADTYINKKGC